MRQRIALIDSGIGGLTIYQQFIKHLPNITYLADNRYFPYGTKKDSDLINIIDRLIFYFLNHHYQYVVLACNTASYIYMKYLRYKYKDSVISIIDSTIDSLNEYDNLQHVGIIVTNQVADSDIYAKKIKERFGINTTTIAASDLVSLCENNDQEAISSYISNHFQILKDLRVDALILGCTHFNLIEKEISAFFEGIPIICSGYAILDKLMQNDLCLMCSQNMIYLTNYEDTYVNKIRNVFKDLKKIKIKSLNI